MFVRGPYLYNQIQDTMVVLFTDRRKNVLNNVINRLNAVRIFWSQLYNELLISGNGLPEQINSKCNDFLLGLILINIMWHLAITNMLPRLCMTSTLVILWALCLSFFWLCDHVLPDKNVFQNNSFSNCFLALIICFDSWISLVRGFISTITFL